jgi:hypothetical protein
MFESSVVKSNDKLNWACRVRIIQVLLYGSEIWGIFSAEKLNKFRDSYFNQLCSNLIAERLHVKFCKYVLEVSRRSTNIAIAGELGRYLLLWI